MSPMIDASQIIFSCEFRLSPLKPRQKRLERSLFRAFLGSKPCNLLISSLLCGEEGIRTPGTRKRTPVFEAGSFNHSDTSPLGLQIYD